MAYQLFLDQHCPCGCGHHRDECLDPDTEGRWQVVLDRSQSQAAIESFREEHKDDLEPGTLLAARLLPPGQIPTDPLAQAAFDPARAAAELEALNRRLAEQEAALT